MKSLSKKPKFIFLNQICIPFVEICSENVHVVLECGFFKNFVLNPFEIEINYDIIQEALIFQTIVVFHSDRLTLELTIFFNSGNAVKCRLFSPQTGAIWIATCAATFLQLLLLRNGRRLWRAPHLEKKYMFRNIAYLWGFLLKLRAKYLEINMIKLDWLKM